MADQIITSDATKQLLVNYIAKPAHAAMLIGPDGIGKGTVAQYIVRSILGLSANANLREQAGVTYVEPDSKGTISIESIRNIRASIRLKTTGTRQYRRAIIIEHAQMMTTEAQNALLKILEEPPFDTIIILTVSQLQEVLPTIQSRVQTLQLVAPTKQQLIDAFSERYSQKQITQAFFLSGGMPGLMKALLENDTEHPLIKSVELAKGLLKGQLFDRMVYIEPIAKQRESALMLCEALERIAVAGLDSAAEKSDTSRMKQWHAILKQVGIAQESLKLHANTKLVLSHLILQL